MTDVSASRTRANKWTIAVTVILGTYVAVIDVTIVNVAMPQMMGTFGVLLDAITWVAMAYSIAEIVVATMASWFTKLLGCKNLYLLYYALHPCFHMQWPVACTRNDDSDTVLQGIGGGCGS